ncbi:hypothetical protein NIES2119_08625 [[Phormidium ambiguum] IAM M-71]|uniref:DUF2254 domain-containing protein n=1 Tax=[Phormidium ambiguum] IAM M-71 TaxID=454136 RepID=A0A1U7IN11_9CYAN|nr:DUF2254 domain-containing protein [Phormidium ambiguum]OKH38650.1 hypothetical protein NIES2119_08625 [Phormidium ambiguum IAM M-71]
MRNVKLKKLWDSLHSSYWFLPSVMVLGGIVLAFTTLALDRTDKVKMDQWSWIYTGGPEGARSLLSAIAGSMVSVAATAFSITIVALQLASANFGPRLLRNFMQDTGNQLVLGTFIGTFIYCLLILRTVRGEDFKLFVPQLSVTVGILLAIASIAVLIFFIHHASTIIQASHVIENVSIDLHRTIENLYPEKIGHNKEQAERIVGEIPEDFAIASSPITANKAGYLQVIDHEQLMKIACKYDLLLKLNIQPGEFIIQGKNLITIYPAQRVNETVINEIHKVFILGKERTEQQDIEFPIAQLVEISMRALSPGINDPFTAIRCIDRITDGLVHLSQRKFPSAYRYDEEKNLRIIAETVSFAELVDSAFNQIRIYGKSDLAVNLKLLESIAVIASYTDNPKYKSHLYKHAEMIFRGSREELSEEQDCLQVQEEYQRVIQVVKNC